VLQFALELPTDTLGEVNHLFAELGHLDRELAFDTRPQGAIAGTLEIEDCLFCDEALRERNVLLLCLEVVGNNLVHATLLKIYNRGARHDEVGVYFFLRFIHRIGEKFHL